MNIKNGVIAFNFIATVLLIVYVAANPIGSTKSISNQISEGSMDDEKMKKFILDNNEVIIEALNRYQEKKAFQESEKLKEMVKSNVDLLEKDPTDPFIGNKDATKVVVEFFDYNCGHCKTMLNVKKKLIEDNADIKIVMKEVPIFGEHSLLLSRSSVAVYNLDASKYLAVHSEFLTNSAKYKDQESVANYVASLGIDKAKFIAMLNDKSVTDKLKSNMELAQKIGLHGTPAYVVNGEVIPGAVEYDVIMNKLK